MMQKFNVIFKISLSSLKPKDSPKYRLNLKMKPRRKLSSNKSLKSWKMRTQTASSWKIKR